MKTIYILLTRSGTLLSNLVYSVTSASYTHASLAFDEDLSCLYSSTRKNGYTMFPAGPSREYLNRGCSSCARMCPAPSMRWKFPTKRISAPSAGRII